MSIEYVILYNKLTNRKYGNKWFMTMGFLIPEKDSGIGLLFSINWVWSKKIVQWFSQFLVEPSFWSSHSAILLFTWCCCIYLIISLYHLPIVPLVLQHRFGAYQVFCKLSSVVLPLLSSASSCFSSSMWFFLWYLSLLVFTILGAYFYDFS